MKEHDLLKIVYQYIRLKFKILMVLCTYLMLFIIVSLLYSIKLEPIIYGIILSSFLTLIVVVVDFTQFYNKHKQLYHLKNHIEVSVGRLPDAKDLIESDYQKIVSKLVEHNNKLALEADLKHTDMVDYYTLWAHQIKTPIAAMQLLLQSESHELNSDLMMQLSTVEQYVEMVLGYLRIDNISSDLTLHQYNVADIVKQGIRKYSKFFIRKDIKLDFQEHDCIVLTDEKWLTFVFEQILFNALKYTHKGKISITIDKHKKMLVIKDTGIGIDESDLPRIFEKGFTGYNGRMDKKATGIGLYLSKKVLSKLSHNINITSQVGIGTTVTIDLKSDENKMD